MGEMPGIRLEWFGTFMLEIMAIKFVVELFNCTLRLIISDDA